jgi:hypothetical protein
MKLSAPHVILVAASTVTIGLLFVALKSNRSVVAAQSKLADATVRQSKLHAEIQRANRIADDSSAAAIAAVAPAAAVRQSASAASPLPPRTRPPSLLDFARENPQVWNGFIQSKRAELGRLYLPVLQRLNLPRQYQERFRDIMAGYIARGTDIGAAADAQGLTVTDPAISALREQSEKQRKSELLELLGPAGYHEFDAYERALPVRGYVDGLATQLATTAPLTSTQADQLERALAESNEAYRNGNRANPSHMDWTSADRRAREILTPAQFAFWEQGTAHSPQGGSRRSQELQAVYDRAVKRMKEAEGVASH